MKNTLIAAATICAAVLSTPLAGAQQAAPAATPNPMDVIPDQMPFNTPYGAPISLADAKKALAASEAEATRRNWAMNCAIMDSGGNLVAFERMDGAQLASIAIAEHKARTAVTFRRETKALEAGVEGGHPYLLTLDGMIGSRGGLPIVEGGKITGSIGCSGGAGSQDEATAKAGLAAITK
jgi:glc operon protein GlcG